MKSFDLEGITSLKAGWDSLQPLSPENEARLWKKLRLEWDYHSNHIEGNTLTYGETELLVIFGETRGNHTIREYEEMKAHDVAVGHVRELAQEKRALTEADIRGLNEILLKEPFWKPAITQDGTPTQKRIIPGQYKTEPNNVRTATGEIFRFADPLDVTHRMHDYLQLLNAQAPTGVNFLLHLAKVHHEFLLIHPFDDGNGRVGRLLLNYLLLKLGFPPVVIRTEEKSQYLSALRLADTEQRDYRELAQFLNAGLQSALLLSIRAAKGESIEEPSDIEKEIALFANQSPVGLPVERKSRETISRLWALSLAPLFKKLVEKSKVLEPLFEEILVEPKLTEDSDWKRSLEKAIAKPEDSYFSVSVKCEHYKRKTNRPFSLSFQTSVSFNKYDFHLSSDYADAFPTRTFSQLLTTSEIDDIIANILKGVFERIKRKAEEI